MELTVIKQPPRSSERHKLSAVHDNRWIILIIYMFLKIPLWQIFFYFFFFTKNIYLLVLLVLYVFHLTANSNSVAGKNFLSAVWKQFMCLRMSTIVQWNMNIGLIIQLFPTNSSQIIHFLRSFFRKKSFFLDISDICLQFVWKVS